MKFTSAVIGLLSVASIASAREPDTTITEYRTGTTVTHRYGRFDKTTRSTTSSTGTHRYGRFDNTKWTTTTIFLGTVGGSEGVALAANASNGSNSSNSTTSYEGGAVLNGINLGVAGALAAGAVFIL